MSRLGTARSMTTRWQPRTAPEPSTRARRSTGCASATRLWARSVGAGEGSDGQRPGDHRRDPLTASSVGQGDDPIHARGEMREQGVRAVAIRPVLRGQVALVADLAYGSHNGGPVDVAFQQHDEAVEVA